MEDRIQMVDTPKVGLIEFSFDGTLYNGIISKTGPSRFQGTEIEVSDVHIDTQFVAQTFGIVLPEWEETNVLPIGNFGPINIISITEIATPVFDPQLN